MKRSTSSGGVAKSADVDVSGGDPPDVSFSFP